MTQKFSVTGILITAIYFLINLVYLFPNSSLTTPNLIIQNIFELLIWITIAILIRQKKLNQLVIVLAGIQLITLAHLNTFGLNLLIAIRFMWYLFLLFLFNKSELKKTNGLPLLKGIAIVNSGFYLTVFFIHIFPGYFQRNPSITIYIAKEISLVLFALFFYKQIISQPEASQVNNESEKLLQLQFRQNKLKRAMVLLVFAWGLPAVTISVTWYFLSGLSGNGNHFSWAFFIFSIIVPIALIIIFGKINLRDYKKAKITGKIFNMLSILSFVLFFLLLFYLISIFN